MSDCISGASRRTTLLRSLTCRRADDGSGGMRDRQMAQAGIRAFTSLCELPIPELLPDQLRAFTIDSLRAKRVRHFNPHTLLSELRASDGGKIIAVDIGGDKLSACYFMIRSGTVTRAEELLTCRADAGTGYLAALLAVSERARREAVPVGISFAGPVDGTRL